MQRGPEYNPPFPTLKDMLFILLVGFLIWFFFNLTGCSSVHKTSAETKTSSDSISAVHDVFTHLQKIDSTAVSTNDTQTVTDSTDKSSITIVATLSNDNKPTGTITGRLNEDGTFTINPGAGIVTGITITGSIEKEGKDSTVDDKHDSLSKQTIDTGSKQINIQSVVKKNLTTETKTIERSAGILALFGHWWFWLIVVLIGVACWVFRKTLVGKVTAFLTANRI